jgi:uncharacterized DUF497 family protein
MENIFDPDKDRLNLGKHKCSLRAADEFDWDASLERLDTREDYQEDRWVAIGPIGDKLYVVVFVERNGKRRIISLRPATSPEVEHYVKTI